MPIGGAGAEIAEITGNGCPAVRREIDPMPIGGALAETAETPAGQVTRIRIISL